VGLILSTAIFGAVSSLPDEQFFSWGWRVPFLLSIVLIAVGLFVRLRVLESPAFLRLKELGAESKAPLIEALRDYPAAAALAVAVMLTIYTGFYVVTTFTLAYATAQLGVSRNVLLGGLLLASAAQFASIVTFARLADRVGRRPVAIWTASALCLLSYPYFLLVDTGVAGLIWLAMSLWLAASGALYGIQGALLAELFPARLRYSGISFGYQIAGVLGGAPAPVIAAALIQWTGGASWPVAAYVSVSSLVSLVAICLTPKSYRIGIQDPLSELRAVRST
jgi:MFS family permease